MDVVVKDRFTVNEQVYEVVDESIPEGFRKETKLVRETKIPFTFAMVATRRKTYKQAGKNDMDLVQEMAVMTKGELSLFGSIEKTMDFTTNLSRVEIPVDKKDRPSFYKAYKLLREKDLVRRQRKEWYMINPDLIIPPADEYHKCKSIYSDCK